LTFKVTEQKSTLLQKFLSQRGVNLLEKLLLQLTKFNFLF